jgi:hypothetical protein
VISTGQGYMRQVVPKSSTVLNFQHDPEQCETTGGVGGWAEVQRPRALNGTEFNSTPLFSLSFILWLNGFETGESVEPTISQFLAWGQPVGANHEPPVLQLVYGNYSHLRWVLQKAEPTATLRRLDGQRVQAQLQVELLEYRGLTATPTAADSVRSQIIAVNNAVGDTHKNPVVATYTIVKGDTLQKIAASKLGNANRWKDIANLNLIKDPIHLKVGMKIKLPAA